MNMIYKFKYVHYNMCTPIILVLRNGNCIGFVRCNPLCCYFINLISGKEISLSSDVINHKDLASEIETLFNWDKLDPLFMESFEEVI